MYFSSVLLLCLSFGAFRKAAGSDWCYTGCAHTPAHWGDVSSLCGGHRQSPIDINTHQVRSNANLTVFTFTNFSSKHVIKSLINNGHTAKVTLLENAVEVSGGGLTGVYTAAQFHFHWGDTTHHPGSEHTVDGVRYPMEMHIVTLKKGLTVEQALAQSEGIAVLGFFLQATKDGTPSGPWDVLTSHLNKTGTENAINNPMAIDDLIGNVSRTKYYRYLGSLTTPDCNEAVVWTVFQEPIEVHEDLLQRFPAVTGLTNTYRPVQNLHGRQVFASPGTPLPPSDDHSWCYDNHCAYNQSAWHLLSKACDGKRQSPVNIVKETTEVNETLGPFTFKQFDDKHTIESIVNTGHAVKCNLKENMVEVSGGGLQHVYSTLQFHFHWGSSAEGGKGSEHTVDSKRFPMEMHIVNKRKDLTLEEAVKTPNGLAVLGFFIEAPTSKSGSSGGGSHGGSSSSGHEDPTSSPVSNREVWKKLLSYLPAIKNISSKVEVNEEISIDDLLGNVSRAAYYRYDGSLTTPMCHEAVVWTVFKESVKVDADVIKQFPAQMNYHNVFRAQQKLYDRKIYRTVAAADRPAFAFLSVLLASLCTFFPLHL